MERKEIYIDKNALPTKSQEDIRIHFDRKNKKIIVSFWNGCFFSEHPNTIMYGWEDLTITNYDNLDIILQIIKNFQ